MVVTTTTVKLSPLGVAALDYAALGWYIFPVWGVTAGKCHCGNPKCAQSGKHPLGSLVPHGFMDASHDSQQITTWWRAVPTANIGLSCGASGLYVIDVDNKPNRNGYQSWIDLKQKHGIDDSTPTFLTGGGGCHYLYSVPADSKLGNTSSKLGPGIDTRGQGGYIVLPPSQHSSGSVYAIDPTWNLSIPILPLPPILQTLLTAPVIKPISKARPSSNGSNGSGKGYIQTALDNELAAMAQASEGHRNDTLNNCAFSLGRLVGGGELARDEVERLLTDAAKQTGLKDDEISTTLASGLEDGIAKPRTRPEPDTGLSGQLIGNPIVPPSSTSTASAGNAPGGTPSPPPPRGRQPKVSSQDLIDFLTAQGYSFRLNLCDDSIEVGPERYSDVIRSQIRCSLRDAGLGKYLLAADDALVAEAARHAYHPAREYLESLTWDGRGHIAYLAGHFTDNHNIFGLYLRKWLIGAVDRVYTGEPNAVLVLEGGQGLGKSKFAKWLCPLPHMFIDANINPDDKDSSLTAMRSWVWEVSEIGATTKRADVEALKGFLSREAFDVRAPYGHQPIHKLGCCSFIGTVNNSSGIFTDSTGSRRYMATTITSIDWESYIIGVDRAQVWAEAFASYIAGETGKLDSKQSQTAQVINEDYAIPDPVEDLLRKHFYLDPDKKDAAHWTGTTEILKVLQDNGLGQSMMLNARYLAATMKKMQHESHNNGKVRGYYGIWA